MTDQELLALVRAVDWDGVLGCIEIPEAEYPLSAAEKEFLGLLRAQVEAIRSAVAEQFDGTVPE